MKLLIKRIVGLLIAILLFANTPGCVITDRLFPPTGSRAGSDLKVEIQSAAMMGYLLGVQTFTSQNPSRANTIKGYGGDPNSGLIQAAVLTGIIAPATSGIKDGGYYTTSSAEDCINGVRKFSLMVAYHQLDHDSFCTLTGYDAISVNAFVSCEYQYAGISAGLTSSGACNLKETGKIIHLNDRIRI